MNRLVPLGLLVALTLSGCASTSQDSTPIEVGNESPARESTNSAASPPDGEQELAYVEVYEFTGALTGTSLPNRSGMGPEVDQMEPTKRDSFEAPAGTTGLVFDTAWPDGTGSMRIEVLTPDGKLVYNSHTWTQVGWAGFTVSDIRMNERSEGGLGAATYTVLFYVAGAMDVSISVTAMVPAVEPQTVAGQT